MVNAQTTSNVPVLESQFSEEIDSLRPISGTGLKGLIYANEKDKVSVDSLFLKISDETVPPIKVSMITPNGNYKADWIIAGFNGTQGWSQLPYKGTKKFELLKYKLNQLAVHAIDANGVTLPVRWSSPEDTSNLILFINSERKDSYFISKENEKAKRSYCDKISDIQTIEVDKVCKVNLDTIRKRDGKIEIRREEGLTRLSSITVALK